MTAPLPEEHARRVLGDLLAEAVQRFTGELTEIVIGWLAEQGHVGAPSAAAQRGADVVGRLRRGGGRRQVRRG